MNPTLAMALVLGFASLLFLSRWIQQRKPDISSNALLVRAETWDAHTPNATAGVVCQKVSIRTPQHRVYRTIYRDAHGQRRPKLVALSVDEAQLRSHLGTAGISWDAPLSASGYQDWHDHQRVRQDQIDKASGGDLLVLTTTVPDGLIAEQKLTVRKTDFHPISRTVLFRNSETIEIAEVEYRILPWTPVTEDLFETSSAPTNQRLIALQPTLLPKLPSVLSEQQLDEAELSARLVLNEFRADTGEQIRLLRTPHGIEVKGLVETEDRRKQLLQELRFAPHTTTAILSIEELSKRPVDEASFTGGNVTSASAQPSPLETYFLAKQRDTAALSNFSQEMVDSALAIEQETHSIDDLMTRFGPAEKMTDLASATLSELLFSHRERLLVALEREQDLLAGLITSPMTSHPDETVRQTLPLIAAADRNLALCKELTLGGGPPPRSAEYILVDLNLTVRRLRLSLHQNLPGTSSAKASSGKR